jgi:hypothetical protein
VYLRFYDLTVLVTALGPMNLSTIIDPANPERESTSKFSVSELDVGHMSGRSRAGVLVRAVAARSFLDPTTWGKF